MGMSEKSSKVEYLKEKINAFFDKEWKMWKSIVENPHVRDEADQVQLTSVWIARNCQTSIKSVQLYLTNYIKGYSRYH